MHHHMGLYFKFIAAGGAVPYLPCLPKIKHTCEPDRATANPLETQQSTPLQYNV